MCLELFRNVSVGEALQNNMTLQDAVPFTCGGKRVKTIEIFALIFCNVLKIMKS